MALDTLFTKTFKERILDHDPDDFFDRAEENEGKLRRWTALGNDDAQKERMIGANQDLKAVVQRVENPKNMSNLFGVTQTRNQLLKAQENMQANQRSRQEMEEDQKIFQGQLG